MGLRKFYLWCLEALFGWAVRLYQIHEEEEKDEKEAAPSPARLIHRDAVEMLRAKRDSPGADSAMTTLEDLFDYVKAGFEVIIEDEVVSSFEVEELPYWNLLGRTRIFYARIDWRLQLVWWLGLLFRYALLVPVRVCLLLSSLLFLGLSTAVVARISETVAFRARLADFLTLVAFRLMSRSVSLVSRVHGLEKHPDRGGICVANHTSPLDIMVLNTKRIYALTGQKHGGMLGFLESSLSKVVPHLWFERSNQKDRGKVVAKMREFLSDGTKPPILIFPEGVCVNNTAVMQFRKGTFEVTDEVYPIGLRYDARFGDAYWSQDLWLEHVWAMISSWAIVCQVFYLDPMRRQPEESASEFADRVKAAISDAVGLRLLTWDGFLKQENAVVKTDLIENEKQKYSERLRQRLNGQETPLD